MAAAVKKVGTKAKRLPAKGTEAHKEMYYTLVVPPPSVIPKVPQVVSILKGRHTSRYKGSMYLSNFVKPDDLKERIGLCIQALQPDLNKFDAIAFTGMSGALIGPPVAMALGKDVLMVRKAGHSSHSSWIVEGDYAARSYIILDDLRQSGRTELHIVDSIAKAVPHAQYVGFLGVNSLYQGYVHLGKLSLLMPQKESVSGGF